MKNSNFPNFGRQGSKFDDLTTDREISTRSIYFARSFDSAITFATCVEN